MLTTIAAPANRAVRCVVFEPRQKPEQEEVILDEFDMLAGETKEYDVRSATAGYRFVDLGPLTPSALNPSEPVPDQEPRYGHTPEVQAEIAAGQERAGYHAEREDKIAELQGPEPTGELLPDLTRPIKKTKRVANANPETVHPDHGLPHDASHREMKMGSRDPVVKSS